GGACTITTPPNCFYFYFVSLFVSATFPRPGPEGGLPRAGHPASPSPQRSHPFGDRLPRSPGPALVTI
ncbi:MAG: hypothetical protein AAGD06_25580, partial [Acidobacteriota bacterium]